MFNFNKIPLLFILGLLIGAYLAHFYIKTKRSNTTNDDYSLRNIPFRLPPKTMINANTKYEKWFKTNGYTRTIHPIDQIRYGNNAWNVTMRQESQYLFEAINILCVILSHNDNTSEDTANAAKHTWAKGCNNVTIVRLEIGNKRKKLPIRKTKENSKWNILCNTIRQIEESREDGPQWVIFVYEQTFVLMENLRFMLAPLNHNRGYYLGQAEAFWNVIYNVAQAGYVLSQESLRLLQTEFNERKCSVDNLLFNKEDFTLGKVLGRLGVFPIDTRDQMGYSTFNVHNWQQEFFPGVNYYKNSVYPRKCCSSNVITFKGIERDKFYMYYYILYQLDVFTTGQLGNRPMTPPKDKDFVWKRFLADQSIYRNVSAQQYYDIWYSVQNPLLFPLQTSPENNNYN